jgi:hypothetical protein
LDKKSKMGSQSGVLATVIGLEDQNGSPIGAIGYRDWIKKAKWVANNGY